MMGPLRYSFVLVLFAAHQCDGNLDDFNDYETLHPHHVNSDWMKCIPDDQPLSAVSIPGTDQSLKEGGVNPYRNFQAWKLSSQLYAGVRFFDMTLWILFGTLYIENNAAWYYEKFAHTVNELQIFLREKTSETVLMRLTGPTDTISQAKVMLSEGTVIHLWKEENIPNMGEARGKIILIQSPDFDWGLPINAMELPTEDKVTQMKANIKKASDHCKNEMMLTDTGAKGQLEKPSTVAAELNKELDDYLLSLLHSKTQPSCIGIIAMDFPGPKLIQQIITLSCHSGTGSNETDTGNNGVLALNETVVRPIPELTPKPTPEPISEPTSKPTTEPITPISEPTSKPSPTPTSEPTSEPTSKPSPTPTSEPSPTPTSEPTSTPSPTPISEPTKPKLAPKTVIIRKKKCRLVHKHKHLPGASPLPSNVVS